MNRSTTTVMPKPSKPLSHQLRRPPRSRLALIVAAGAVLFLIGSVLVTRFVLLGVEQERDGAADQAVTATDPIRALCAEETLVGEALRADLRNPCGLAQQVLADPIPTVTPPIPLPRDGRDASPEQIQSAVAVELARNPPADGRTPTLGEVTAIVARLLADNPDQIATQVALYIAANPIRDGVDGDDAPEITPAQIQAAVAAELAANPPERGEMGDRGPQGIGVTDVRTVQTEQGCQLVFTLTNPADGTTVEQSLPVPKDFCRGDEPVVDVP